MVLSSRSLRRFGGVVGCFGAVSALVVALLHPGVVSTEVDLNDGGVWVTNTQSRLVAHLNYPARQLDSGFRAPSTVFNVFQKGEQVLINDGESASLAKVNVAAAIMEQSIAYEGLVTSFGGGTVALADAAKGKVWVQNANRLTALSAEDTPPALEDLPGVQTAVGLDGSVHAVSAEAGRIVSLLPRGTEYDRVETPLEMALTTESILQITAVGTTPIVLDKNTGVLHLGKGKTQTLTGHDLTLQEPGPAADSVLIASDSALIDLPLAGGEPHSTTTTTPGRPSRPVRHLGCTYGAWSGSGAFLRQCTDHTFDAELTVDGMKTAEQAVFRVNRDVIVLNDVDSGKVWLPDDAMVLVDNWDQIESAIESEENSEEDAPDESQQTLLPERSEKNTPPEAVDDEFGVRAGRVSILPVVVNDSDIDGDYLTVTPTSQPALGTVTPARDGAALQISVNPQASGSAVFTYEVNDGRGGLAQASVTVNVHANDVNSPPHQVIVPSISVGSGRKATVNAIADWIDPDGDPFFLASAVAPVGINVRSHSSGTIEVSNINHAPGSDVIGIHVSDGRATGEGTVDVTVQDNGNAPPVANADHLVVRMGSSAVASPLLNDTDPNGDPLRLVQIEASPNGVSAQLDGATSTIRVEGLKIGTYYLGYVVTDGPSTAPGVIRIDVVDGTIQAPPAPEPDLGVLPNGGQVLIDLLANDSDPTGGVLTVQKVDIQPQSPLLVALVNHQLVRVSAPRGLTQPETFSYTVSNGNAQATATVTIIPTAATTGGEPPELEDDQIIVRAGDIGSVAVLANDRSPAGLKMTVSNDLQHEISADLGEVFISDNIVRVRGGKRPGSGKIIYTVHDSAGNVASATVNLLVVAMDESTNTAPRPKDLEARTIAGGTTAIPIPLDSIDPEGDSVTLLGAASAPKMGSVTQEGNILKYTASPGVQGTDSFTYLVQDRLGKQAHATILVGIAPQAQNNQKPVALPDQVLVRPKSKVAVAVMANDIDPDGDDLVLEKDSVNSPTPGLDVSLRSGRVIVVAPEEEGAHVISYGIHDAKGGKASGILTVIVQNEAPILSPIARDDAVSEQMMATAQEGHIIVPVLDNDEDPDGDIHDVTITSPDANIKVNSDKTISVTPTATEQLLIYTITDVDAKSASAVIRVPGTAITRPTLDTTTVPIRVKAGVATDIPINSHVKARDGRPVIITSEHNTSAGLGHDGSPLVKDTTTLTFRANENFSGPTSITVEVTDGKDLNDPDGITGIITLPIEVEAVPGTTPNRPPTFTPTGIEVTPGEDAISVDLSAAVSDQDNDDPTTMTYTIAADTPQGITAAISGTTLTVSAAAQTPKGTTVNLQVKVDDGKEGTTQAAIPITVVASNRPLTQITPASITLDAGKSTSIDISTYATNPFPELGPLTLGDTLIVSEGGTAQAEGTTITAAANTGFNGTFTISYTVIDATTDISRHVQGVITATVRDKPGAPTNVTAVSNSSGTAQISWTAGAANGTPITTFTVTDHTQGDSKECGLVTTCLFPGRTNGIEHVFSVTATNEVGVSEPSAQAATMIDIEPEAPSAPTLTPGDRMVTVSWNAPHNDGSAIVDYEVSLSPGGTQTVPSGQTSVQFGNLTNSVIYVATVRARNAKGYSPLSATSAPAIPYGRPSAVRNLGAVYQLQSTGTNLKSSVHFTWEPPSNTNGRNIEYFELSGGGISKRIPGNATETTIEGLAYSPTPVEFTVTAVNDGRNPAANSSPAVTTSVWVVGNPTAPFVSRVAATGQNNELAVYWRPGAATDGWRSEDLSYEWSAGGEWYPLVDHLIRSPELVNGRETSIRIRAVGNKTGFPMYSEVVSAGPISAYGPPVTGTVSCTPQAEIGVIQCSWSGASGNGRDSFTTMRVEGPGINTEDVGFAPSGQRSASVGAGQQGRLCLSVIQSTPDGNQQTRQACSDWVTAKSAPKRGIWQTFDIGDPAPVPTSPCREYCLWLKHQVSGWDPHSRIRCTGTFTDSAQVTATWWSTVTTNEHGAWEGSTFWTKDGAKWTKLVYNHTQYRGDMYFDSLSCDYE